jgi:hypothetical protein
MPGQGQIGADRHATAVTGFDAEPGSGRRGGHAGGPDQGAALDAILAERGTFGVAARDPDPELQLDAQSCEIPRRTRGQRRRKAGQQARLGFDQDDAGGGRIGATRRVVLEFENSDKPIAELDRLLRGRGRAWSVAPDEMDRAASTTEQILQHISDAGLMTGSPSVTMSYNDFDLTIAIRYQGALLSLPNVRVRKHFFLEESPFRMDWPIFSRRFTRTAWRRAPKVRAPRSG